MLKILAFIPQSAINNGLPRPDIEPFSLRPMVESPLVFLSPINDPGISRVTRLKEYRKCRTRYNAPQWIKVDERFIHGNLWLLAKVVYNILMS